MMNFGKTRAKAIAWCGKGILATVLATGIWSTSAGAVGATADTIRVGLFMDLGSTYKSTTPSVTLSSGQAWGAGFNTGTTLVSFSPNEQVKFSVDGYRVKVLETTDLKTANDAYKKLESTADKPFLFSVSSAGKLTYQLYTGNYASEQAAKEAASRTAKTASAQLNGQVPAVKGSNYLSAGIYASQAQAEAAMNSITAAGLDAMVVLQQTSDGNSQFAVWVGEAANAADLATVQSTMSQLLPQTTLTAVDPSVASLIVRQDVSLGQAVRHYQVSGDSAKCMITGDSSGIKVTERSNHTYRGSLEISILNGQLALVNEVPFEQYIYAVVGGEVPSSWPMESLKAQAVSARSYAASTSNKFKIADVVDTTLSQVYNGISAEAASVIQAVDATKGEILMQNGKVVEAVFSSNAGGFTADTTEVWNSGGDAFAAVPSAEDNASQMNLKSWYHVLLSNGDTGYVREDNVKNAGSTAAGLTKLTVTAKDTNIRPIPQIQSNVNPVAKLNIGDTVVVLEKVEESSSYAWMRGPYTSAELVKSLQGKTSTPAPSTITTLEVTKRGPSGRVIQIKANGQILDVKYPDMFRSAMNGLPSTLFDIVPTGSYTVLGAGGDTAKVNGSATTSVISATGVSSIAGAGTVVMNGDMNARVLDNAQGFMFTGFGNGHGLGLSQWGAKGMADAGYGYQDILKHYYQNVTIVKD